jgi:cellulose synthase/poly-beta-1,6-N-acetylglucosamine synthase-like glycosyltransferase
VNLPSVSFLIPAHNEETVIYHALDSLQEIASPKIEVLVGLDGCTDGTKEVVSRYPFVRYIELDERGGKPAVLRRLMELAQGRIAIVHDADWRFVCNEEGLEHLITCFEDPALGGIVLPPHNIPFWGKQRGITSRAYLGAGLGILLLDDYRRLTQTKQLDGELYVDRDKVLYPFTMDVFRRDAITDLDTAADDFERFMVLLEAGYELRVFDDTALPYFEIVDRTSSYASQYRRRVRGHIARAQLESRFPWRAHLLNFYLPLAWYSIKNAGKVGLTDLWAVLAWYGVLVLSLFRARLVLRSGVPGAKEAWRWSRSRGYQARTERRST